MPAYRARDLFLVPNALSAARIPLAVAFPFVVSDTGAAITVLAAAAATDILDGWLARRLGQATPLGALIDGVTDKVFAASLLASLLATGKLSPLLALLLATRELGELPLAIRLLANKATRQLELDRGSNLFGKVATGCEFVTVLAALVGARHLDVWVGITAVLGAIAAGSYWVREIRATRANGSRIYVR